MHAPVERPPSVLRRRVGSVEIVAMTDAVGTFFEPLTAAFPGVHDSAIAEARGADPAVFDADGQWRIPFRVYVIVPARGPLTVVDAGVGPAGSTNWMAAHGRLPALMASIGISPDDIGVVVLTHLHSDHTGWVLPAPGRPLFANAEHVIQRAETDALPPDSPHQLLVEALRESNLLREIDGECALRPETRVLATPGHTPGHQSVVVRDGDSGTVLAGDVLVHRLQMLDSAQPYAHDADHQLARSTRAELLRLARRERYALGSAHLGDAFVDHAYL